MWASEPNQPTPSCPLLGSFWGSLAGTGGREAGDAAAADSADGGRGRKPRAAGVTRSWDGDPGSPLRLGRNLGTAGDGS